MSERDDAKDDSETGSVTLELYAEVLAHIRFFTSKRAEELLLRFEIDPGVWSARCAYWGAAIIEESEAGETNALSRRFSAKYGDTFARLKREKPKISDIGRSPVPPETPEPKPRAVDMLPPREPETPTYLLPKEDTDGSGATSAQSVLATVTMPTPDAPLGPATPFASAQPDESGFSLPDYASFCAELVQASDRDAVLARHGIDRTKQAMLDRHWRAKFRADTTLGAAFQRSYGEHVLRLQRERRGPQAEPAPPTKGSSLTTTVVLGDPAPPDAPKVSLVEHAELCAQIALGMDTAAELARRFMTAEDKTAADAHYRQIVAKDRAAHQAWQVAFDTAKERILRALPQRRG